MQYMYNVMCIPKYPIYDPNNIRHTYQHAYSSDKFKHRVTFDDKTADIEYQVYAYPYGHSMDKSKGKHFNFVIQLLDNPLNLKLKASYSFWFWDRLGEKHFCEDDTTFDKRTVSNDIRFMSSTDFQGCMSFQQKIEFKITFSADEKLQQFPPKTDNECEFTCSFPASLKKFPCIRLSPEYWCSGIKWQCRLFKKNDELLIDFQIIQNPMLKHFVAKFKILEKDGQNSGFKLGEVSHKFGPDSFCSDAVLIKSLLNFPEKFEVEIVPNFV
uniref:Uncharacterized protein n=1 Tax=Panagrolaimus davidi TaxID=227884 RepID=A0A914QWF3_9BILA